MRFLTIAGFAGLVISGLAVAGAPESDYFSPDTPLSARDKKNLAPAKQWINSATYPIRKDQSVTYWLVPKSKLLSSQTSTATSGIVPDGMVWLLSDSAPDSYDSRYFGPLPLPTIQAVVRPLWVF